MENVGKFPDCHYLLCYNRFNTTSVLEGIVKGTNQKKMKVFLIFILRKYILPVALAKSLHKNLIC